MKCKTNQVRNTKLKKKKINNAYLMSKSSSNFGKRQVANGERDGERERERERDGIEKNKYKLIKSR